MVFANRFIEKAIKPFNFINRLSIRNALLILATPILTYIDIYLFAEIYQRSNY